METVSRDAAVVLLSAVGCCCLTAGAGAGILTLALTQTAAHHVSGELSIGEPREVCSLWMTFLADWFHNELFCGSYLMCICDLMTIMHTTEKE